VRRVVYSVASSLDGCIAGPNDEFDWIVTDPEIDFGALFRRFDTVLMGRKSYEAARRQGGGAMPGLAAYVFSTAVVPVLLGGGRPLLEPPAARATLRLTKHTLYSRTGTVLLDYGVVKG